ncbi:hypothetical protein K432DRAFT_429982 [Lepidopterella palustris CBS 459.81]|uniref:HNH nuclease domain-containing protein n=1 Tax=Lepidopterella palustris CBS 459.81 TaxID=1314670 RepID=A0A8E2DZA2_9PEZI|nr:hypothetical protein K432DRAFT_429982 [Lepidopterella palustris CBS 459.81]
MDPDQRSKMINEIHSIIQQPIHRVLWAVLQVCDEIGVEYVLKLARMGSQHCGFNQRDRKQTQDPAPSTPASSSPCVIPSKVSTSTPGRSPVPSPAASSTSSRRRKRKADDKVSTPRNVALPPLCRERDKARCVLTGLLRLEVAHIYPHGMPGTPPNRHISWKFLGDNWAQEQIIKWFSPLFRDAGSTGCDVVFNMLCLAPHARHFWEISFFALKPEQLSDDRRTLRSQHQAGTTHEGAVGPEGAKLHNIATDQPIKSGDVIEPTTDDPDLRPLPSIDLLHMQWVLQQIAALAAGAEPIDLEKVDSDDDDDIDLPVALLEGEGFHIHQSS